MLARASAFRRALVPMARYAGGAPRRTMAEAAAAAEAGDESKLKLNFFLPHKTVKSEAMVVC